MTESTFEGFACVELMGHRQRVGHVREVEIAGGKMLRVDVLVPDGEPVTEFYGASAIYALRPISEEVARAAAERASDVRPIRPADFRPAPAIEHRSHHEPEYDDGGEF